MAKIADKLAEKLTGITSAWPGVECVLLCNFDDIDDLDPYFALVLDIYCSGPIPTQEERMLSFENPGAFETSRNGEKDRFFLEGIPIRLEYKKISRIEKILVNMDDPYPLFESSGTYPVFRLINGRILYSRTDWIKKMITALSEPPVTFWQALFDGFSQKIEHYLSDLGGAAYKNDKYFFLVSVVGFMDSCAALLFSYNRKWEPSDRNLNDILLKLPLLPEDFPIRWNTIMRLDGTVSPERCYQIAGLIVRSFLNLSWN